MASKKQKCYIFWLVFFFLASIGLLAGLLYMIIQKKDDDKQRAMALAEPETCLTKHCTLSASMLIDAMDTSVDPCENFYEFSCANFIRTHPVPVDEDYTSAAWTFNKNFQLQLKNLVEGMGSLKGPNVMYRMQEAYHVCLNTTFQPDKELLAFKNFTQKTLHWPLASNGTWRPKYPTLTEYMAMYEENGLGNPFVQMIIAVDREDELAPYKILIMHIWEQSFLIKPTIGSSPVFALAMNVSMKFVKDVVHLLGNKDDRAINNDIKEIRRYVDFVEELDKSSSEENEDSSEESTEFPANVTESNTYKNLTFRELTELTGTKINWLHVVNKKLRGKYEFSEDDEVYIIHEEVFKNLKLITENFPLRVLVNIMGWETLYPTLLKQAGPQVEELLDKYEMEMGKIINSDDEKQTSPRWKQCLESSHNGFMLVVTRMFLETYVDRSEKQSADEMIQWITKAYKQAIYDSEWLDEATRQSAIDKAEAIKRFVGYPDFIFDDKALDKAYEAVLPEVRSTHFQNVVEMILDASYRGIPDIDDTEETWDMSPLIVNAYYSQSGNSIWFPSAILQLPFFQDNRLAAMNFGMIGAVIGHELGHAFDDDGSQHNAKGQKYDWWTNQTREVFEKKSECFVDQYNNFCPEYLQGENDTVCVNGRYTLGENLADSTGLDAAFMAYRMWVEEHGEEKRLPGLREFSPEQLFFIGNAYVWCENIPADKWVELHTFDSHAPGKYRVLGTTSNSRFFREVFNCPVGPMNRGDDSCTVW